MTSAMPYYILLFDPKQRNLLQTIECSGAIPDADDDIECLQACQGTREECLLVLRETSCVEVVSCKAASFTIAE